ncbi:MAG: ATP-binding protein [Pseudomonadota bacterium]
MQDIIIKETPGSISCIFASSLLNIDKSCRAIKKFIAAKKINCNLFEFIYILREALNNAVIHGNRNDDTLQVECTVVIERDKLTITVTDQGTGFDWHSHLLKNKVSSTAPSGRGIHSLFQYGFTISYNESGNTLYLTKKII